jgi:hypothetical protein
VDDFIDLAEAELNNEVRAREMEALTTTVATAGYLINPTDWLAWKVISLSSGGKKYDLNPYSSENAIVQQGTSGSTAATGYEVIGDKTYLVPTGSGSYRTIYYQKIPALTSSANTNWLLTNYPHIYLGRVLKFASLWGVEDARIPGFIQVADQAVARLNNASSLGNYGQVPQARPDRFY